MKYSALVYKDNGKGWESVIEGDSPYVLLNFTYFEYYDISIEQMQLQYDLYLPVPPDELELGMTVYIGRYEFTLLQYTDYLWLAELSPLNDLEIKRDYMR